MKHVIQDLIDDGVITVDPSLLASNSDHTIFKYPLGNHDKEKPSSSNSNSQGNVNYTRTTYDYTINCFNESDLRISTFTLKAEDPCCAVTTCYSKITLPGAPSRPAAPTRPTPPSRPTAPTSSDYSLFEQLEKTPALISILDLLRASPQHQKILDQALKESVVPNKIDVAQFQAMVGNLSASQHITFSP